MDWTKTPVNAYLPEFQLKDPLLTSQLNLTDILSHRSVSVIKWVFSHGPKHMRKYKYSHDCLSRVGRRAFKTLTSAGITSKSQGAT